MDGRGWDEHAIRIERKVVDWIGFSAKHHRAGFMPFIFGDYCYCCWWISQLTVDSLIMQNIVGFVSHICASVAHIIFGGSSARQLVSSLNLEYEDILKMVHAHITSSINQPFSQLTTFPTCTIHLMWSSSDNEQCNLPPTAVTHSQQHITSASIFWMVRVSN